MSLMDVSDNDELSLLRKQNADLMKLLQEKEVIRDESIINPKQTDLVRIEVTKSKGDFSPRELSDEDIVTFWTSTLAQPGDILDQFDQHRLPSGALPLILAGSLSFSTFYTCILGTGRVIYRLKKPIDLQQISVDPYSWFNKAIQGDIVTYTCKILDLNLLPTAKLGSEVTVSIRQTHAEVPKSIIDSWLKLYGTFVSDSRLEYHFCSFLTSCNKSELFRFVPNSLGYKTELYVCQLKLEFHIPEFLPIQGKRARVFYHGIPSFCGKCHKVGHLKVDCKSSAVTWLVKRFSELFTFVIGDFLLRHDYIKRLRDAGVQDVLFGSWLDSNPVEGPAILDNVPQPVIEKEPETPGIPTAQLVNFLSTLIQAQSATKPEQPLPSGDLSETRRSQFGRRGRGRGRGGYSDQRGTKRRLSEGDTNNVYKKNNTKK